MGEAEGRLRYRRKGGLAWRELSPGMMPERGDIWEVQSPDGAIALLSRSDAPPKAPPPPPDETDSFHLEFGQDGDVLAGPASPGADLPVFQLSAMDSGGLKGPASSCTPRPAGLEDPEGFGLLVEGETLEPRFSAGQILLVDTTKSPEDGEWCVAGLDTGEIRIARWNLKKGKKVSLESPRLLGKAPEFASDQIRFAYKIVWARFP